MARKRTSFLGYLPTHTSFRPYVTAIGQAAVAWNALHEAFRSLFWDLLGITNIGTHTALWYSIKNDRAQREMVRALANSAHEFSDLSDAGHDRISWLLTEATKLSEARDDAVHSPLISAGPLRDGKPFVRPASHFGHPRAQKLAKKDLLVEFRWCRDAAVTLTEFCLNLDMWLASPQSFSLPDIPRLPKRGQKKNRQGQRRRPPPK